VPPQGVDPAGSPASGFWWSLLTGRQLPVRRLLPVAMIGALACQSRCGCQCPAGPPGPRVGPQRQLPGTGLRVKAGGASTQKNDKPTQPESLTWNHGLFPSDRRKVMRRTPRSQGGEHQKNSRLSKLGGFFCAARCAVCGTVQPGADSARPAASTRAGPPPQEERSGEFENS
jgi:hypothetical protein